MGQSASFRVKVTGGKAPYTYQWVATTDDEVYNGDDYGDESNNPNLEFPSIMEHQAGSYWCVITDVDGNRVTSNSATLTVTGVEPLHIVTQPKSQTVEVGKTATFTVAVSGGRSPYRYSWQVKSGSYSFDEISTDSVSMTVTPTEAGTKTYRVVIQDTAVPSKTTISDEFTLVVTESAVTPTHTHKWKEVIDKKATTTATGLKHEECSICGKKQKLNTVIPKLVKHTVSFSANGGKGTMKSVTITDTTYTLPANKFTAPSGKRFKGWATSAKGKVITTKTMKITKNTKLYAIWEYIPLKKGATFTGSKIKAQFKVTDANKLTVAYIKSTNKNATSISIPATVSTKGKTYKVTSIEKNAFKSNKKIKTLTIGSNVSSIKEAAFSGCTKLKTITIKTEKLTDASVSSDAFKGTPDNATVKVPSKKLTEYKKWLTKKGISKKAKITK